MPPERPRVRLVHPNLPGRVIEVGPHAARVHRLSGWVDASVEPPPESGRGSGRDAWVAYAQQLGVEVDEDDTRDDLIAKTRTSATSPDQE